MSAFEATVSRIAGTHPELRISYGGAGDGYDLFSALADEENTVLGTWLAAIRARVGDVDCKTAAAYFISIFAWQFGQVLGALYLSGGELPHLTPDNVAARFGPPRDAGEGIGVSHFRFRGGAGGQPFDRVAMRESIIDLHEPLVEGLHKRTSLARQATWRLVTDGMAAGFLGVGKITGVADLAVTEASEILLAPGPLHNEDWRFVLVEEEAASEWFRLRGGCCRLYRSAEHDFCTTCVLRSQTEQVERLRALLQERARRPA